MISSISSRFPSIKDSIYNMGVLTPYGNELLTHINIGDVVYNMAKEPCIIKDVNNILIKDIVLIKTRNKDLYIPLNTDILSREFYYTDKIKFGQMCLKESQNIKIGDLVSDVSYVKDSEGMVMCISIEWSPVIYTEVIKLTDDIYWKDLSIDEKYSGISSSLIYKGIT